MRTIDEALKGLGIAGEAGREEFEHDMATKARGLSFLNHTHAVFNELGDDFILRDGLAEHCGQGESLCRRAHCFVRMRMLLFRESFFTANAFLMASGESAVRIRRKTARSFFGSSIA